MRFFAEHRRDEKGHSLVSILVGLVLMSAAMLPLAASAGLAARATAGGRSDMHLWSATTWVTDSLRAEGWGNVTAGSGSWQGYPMTWTVSGSDPQRVDLIVGHVSVMTRLTFHDTLIIYLSK